MKSDLRQLRELLRRAVEICMPDLRRYYRVVRQARVVKAYASDGRYWCDVQPLRNDGSEDPAEPLVPRVSIPILWAGPDRGVVCPPRVGVICDLAYYDGSPDFPHLSNFRWPEGQAPQCELDGFILQADPDTHIKIDAGKRIICVTPANAEAEIGGDWLIKVDGDVRVEAGGTVTHKTAGPVSGVVTGLCICALTGMPHIDKSSTVLASKE